MKFNEIFKNKFITFSNFESAIRNLNCSAKEEGDIFEEFVFAYFSINKNMYNIKSIYMEKDIPEDIRNVLKLENTDHGVDGVFVTEDEKLYAYQVKFRSNPNNPPTYSELATFLTESENAYARCTITNCLFLPKIIDKKSNHFAILGNVFNELDEEFFENLHRLALEESTFVTKKTPKKHQQKIINDVISGFKENNRGKVISACGTGKTLTSLWIMEQLNNINTVLFVVPNLSLISQTLKEWSTQASSPFSYICVCSDCTVSNGIDDNSNSIAELPFLVTTNPENICEFLRHKSNFKKIIFSTYQSLDALAFAINDIDFCFDLGIFDEAHRTAGAKNSSCFMYGLEDEYIKIAKRLFMTATERIVTTRIKNSLKDTEYEIYSMDDESVYGPVFSRLSFGEAINNGIISDYNVVIACVKSSEYLSLINTNRIVTSNDNRIIDIVNLTKQIILVKAYEELGIGKVISYHQNVNKAKAFIKDDYLKNMLIDCLSLSRDEIYCGHVNGEMSAKEKYIKFNAFENHPFSILTNARCLTEGVDIPAIDAVYFSDPRSSTIDIIQAVGRSLRISDKKVIPNQSFIIIPIIIPDEVNSIKDCDCKLFETLHCVVQALRDQDSRLADIIDDLNLSIATNGTTQNKLNDKIKIIAPQSINYNDLFDNISLRIAEVNKEPTENKIRYVIEHVHNARASSFVRRFRTMGDMTAEAYRDSLVIPTIQLFKNVDDVKEPADLKFNHNNYSHSMRLGVINEIDGKTILTKNGKKIYNNQISFDEFFNSQMLYYAERNPDNDKLIFPYRSLMRIMIEIGSLSQLEFVFALYTLKESSREAELNAINTIYHIRCTYPNIEILSQENQEKILNILNNKFDLNFSYQDVWTNRSTVYNQFNYFKCHLVHFSNAFTKTSKSIIFDVSKKQEILNLLLKTNFIENMDDSKRLEFFKTHED